MTFSFPAEGIQMAPTTMADQALIRTLWFKPSISWSDEKLFPKSCAMGNEARGEGGVCVRTGARRSPGRHGGEPACISVFTEHRGFLRRLVLLFT